ncbi:MAG TPA: NEW3 domain-containing protein [Candidatus Limnocylindrales bacterium]|nr:NEW3 domain-containing protein [Candidatus Limnocylindrales bacterium]
MRRPAIALAAAAVMLAGLVPAVVAATPFAVTTPYPQIAVAPGSTASFDLSITAPRDGIASLAVTGAPTGWTATLHGGGFVVSGIAVTSAKAATARLDVKVPGDTTVTQGNMTVTAKLGSDTATLPISVAVNANVAGAVTVSSDSPTLTGPNTTTFSFDLTVNNGTAQDQTISAKATAPSGWTVTTKLSDAQAASTIVKAGASSTVTVSATPPQDAPAGHTDIDVTVTAGTQQIPGKLGVDITGSFKITLSTPNQLISMHGPAGSVTTQQVVVKNDGTAPLTNVKMTGSVPSNWKIDFDQPTIAQIAPGDQATVTASITPSGDAVTGDYQVTITGNAPGDNGTNAATNDLAMTFTVETSPIWLLAGVALIIVILAALFYVFRTYGRR